MPHEVEIHLHGGLHKFASRARRSILVVENDASVMDICGRICLSKKEIYLIKVDGTRAKLEDEINDGEKVDIFPVFGGG